MMIGDADIRNLQHHQKIHQTSRKRCRRLAYSNLYSNSFSMMSLPLEPRGHWLGSLTAEIRDFQKIRMDSHFAAVEGIVWDPTGTFIGVVIERGV